ncbi:MAG: TonB family protein [Terriglobales bacterium]
MATTPASEFHSPSYDGILLAEELLDLAERAQAYTNAAGIALALRRGQDLLVRTSTGCAPDVGSIIPTSDGFIADCLRTRRPLCCRDTESDGRVGPLFRALKIRSLIAVPICEHRDAKGVLIVIAPLPNAFQPTHSAILMTLSDIIASKLAARDAMPNTFPDITAPAVEPAPEPPKPAPVVKPAASAASKPAPPPAPALKSDPAPMPWMAPSPNVFAQEPSWPAQPLSQIPDAPAVPESAGDESSSIPAALLRLAAIPLPEAAQEAEPDPSLLSPSEDPTRFKRPIAVSTTFRPRPPLASANTTPLVPVIKPATTVPESMVPKPAMPPAKPVATKPPAPAPKPAAVMKPAPAVVPIAPAFQPVANPSSEAAFDVTPSMGSWNVPSVSKSQSRLFVRGGAAAAALIIFAGFWMYVRATREVAPPAAAAIPAAPAVVAAVKTPVAAASPTSSPKIEFVAKSAERQPQKSSSAEDTTTELPKHTPAPVHVIEIASAKPRAEFVPDMPAPKLSVPSTNDSTLSSISKLPVAVPERPKSELVQASVVSRVAPTYPSVARQMHIFGAVIMTIEISDSGRVGEVKVISGPMQLRSAAVEAVRQWRYKPATLNGQPTSSTAEVQVNFAR